MLNIGSVLKNRQGVAMLVNMIIVALMMGIMATSFVQLSSAQFSNADSYRFAYQAQQLVEAKANEIAVMPYTALTAEPRAAVTGATSWQREVLLGTEITLPVNNNKQRPVTVNVYYGGESVPRASVIKYPTVAGTVVFWGTIAVWYGSAASIPYGWALCDGTNGTPDLRSRFVYGAGGDVNTKGSYVSGWNNVNGHLPVSATGGEEMHVLTINEMPSHSHVSSMDFQGLHTHHGGDDFAAAGWSGVGSLTGFVANGLWDNTTFEGSHTHNVTIDLTGGGSSHNIIPRFYALCYIMKLNI